MPVDGVVSHIRGPVTGLGRDEFQQSGIGEEVAEQAFGAALAVHVGKKVGKLRPGIQQLAQGIHPACHGCWRKVLHLFERQVDRQVSLSGQGIFDTDRHPRLHRTKPGVEIVDIDFEHLTIDHIRQGLHALSGKIGHHPDDERQLHLAFAPVKLDVVLDLDPGRPVAADELLTA